jgi:hypothetical protein
MNQVEKDILNKVRNINEKSSLVSESLLDDLKTLISTASESVKNSEEYKKIKDFFSDYISDTSKKEEIPLEDYSISDDEFYKGILNCLNAPITKENMMFLYAWRQAEGGSAKNNPFNTTKSKSNSTFYNCLKKDNLGGCSSGVRNYSTRRDGIEATCDTLKLPQYQSLVSQLKSGESTAKEMANNQQALKTWGTGSLISQVVDGYLAGYQPKPKPISV